jgi:hypothetical protein
MLQVLSTLDPLRRALAQRAVHDFAVASQVGSLAEAELAKRWQRMQPSNYIFWPAMEVSSPLVAGDQGLTSPLPLGVLHRVFTWNGSHFA